VPVVLKKEKREDAAQGRVFIASTPIGRPAWSRSTRRASAAHSADYEMARSWRRRSAAPPKDLLKVEAKFDVAEYENRHPPRRRTRSARHLLKENKYKIPAKRRAFAEAVRPEQLEVLRRARQHEESRSADARPVLSPLRFHYDSEKFELPVRLAS